jgi:hypothetical protein
MKSVREAPSGKAYPPGQISHLAKRSAVQEIPKTNDAESQIPIRDIHIEEREHRVLFDKEIYHTT